MAAVSHELPDRGQQKMRVLHVLIINVPGRNADEVWMKSKNCICDPGFPLATCSYGQQPHVMTCPLRSSSDACETNRQRSSELARFLHRSDEQDLHSLTSSVETKYEHQSKRHIEKQNHTLIEDPPRAPINDLHHMSTHASASRGGSPRPDKSGGNADQKYCHGSHPNL